MERRLELSESHQRQLVDCSGPTYESNRSRASALRAEFRRVFEIQDRSPREASDLMSGVL